MWNHDRGTDQAVIGYRCPAVAVFSLADYLAVQGPGLNLLPSFSFLKSVVVTNGMAR